MEGDTPAGALGTTLGLVVLAGCWGLRRPLGEHARAREEAWIRARPFPLHGVLEALASRQTEGRFALDVVFDAPPGARALPSEELLRDVFRTVEAEASLRPGQPVCRLVRRWSFDSSVLTNAHTHAWVHEVCALLETLHARHPLREVRVHGFDGPPQGP
jgi:hypothetical protein